MFFVPEMELCYYKPGGKEGSEMLLLSFFFFWLLLLLVFNHCIAVLCLQPVLIFLLFKPCNTIAGVNLLASVISKGSVSEACCY